MSGAALALALAATSTPTLALSSEIQAWHREAVLWESAAHECVIDLGLAHRERDIARDAATRCEARDAATPRESPGIASAVGGALLGAGGTLAGAGAIGCERESCRIGAISVAIGLMIAGLAGLFF